jgi:predicted nucleotidyltransferase component of viral defense system
LTSAESIKAKLKKLTKTEGRSFDYFLMHYLIERLLYRLSISSYSGNFILKGGLLLYSVLGNSARATRDIDFLAQRVKNVPEELARIFMEIANIQLDDAVSFNAKSIAVSRIKEGADYQGVRVKMTVLLDRSRHVLQFDIGFGDVIVPKPVDMTYPSLLDMESPRLKAYSLESVIAEKFQAIVYLAEANSRMKDFYDISELSYNFDFEGPVLSEAIKQTFKNRKTPYVPIPTVFSEGFSQSPDKQTQWGAFQKRITASPGRDFPVTITAIKDFLLPVYNALYRKKLFSGQWDSDSRLWRNLD